MTLKKLVTILCVIAPTVALANKPTPSPEPPETTIVNVDNSHHGNAAVGAVVGAAITYWLVHRHKHHPAPACHHERRREKICAK